MDTSSGAFSLKLSVMVWPRSHKEWSSSENTRDFEIWKDNRQIRDSQDLGSSINVSVFSRIVGDASQSRYFRAPPLFRWISSGNGNAKSMSLHLSLEPSRHAVEYALWPDSLCSILGMGSKKTRDKTLTYEYKRRNYKIEKKYKQIYQRVGIIWEKLLLNLQF